MDLMKNTRFNEVKTLNDIDFRTSALADFPAPLTWEIVGQICTESKTDALFAIEKLDSILT